MPGEISRSYIGPTDTPKPIPKWALPKKCGVCGVTRCDNHDGINCYASHPEKDWRDPKVFCHGKCVKS